MSESELEKGIKKIQLYRVGEQHMISYEDRNFHLQPFLFNTISDMQKNGIDYVWTHIDSSLDMTDADKAAIKTKILDQINAIVSGNKKKSYIGWSFPLLSREKVDASAALLTPLFNKYIAVALLGLGLLAAALFITSADFQVSKNLLHLSLQETVSVYFFTIIILLFHEFGHATAAKFHGVCPREIGVGFYMGLPVFFANVSDIWRLERRQRIIINLGGVYFQLIVCIPLYALTVLAPREIVPALDKIFKINIFIAAYVLIPFIRNDGYWVFSDYFNIPNLNEKSYTAPYRYARKLLKNIEFQENSPALILYSAGNYVFIVYFLYLFFSAAPSLIWSAGVELANRGLFDSLIENSGLLISALISLMGMYLLSRALLKKLILISKPVTAHG